MESVYGASCPDETMVYKWHSFFKQGRALLGYNPRHWRPIDATTPEIIPRVEKKTIQRFQTKEETACGNGWSIGCDNFRNSTLSSWLEKTRWNLTKRFLLLQGNALVHKTCVALAALQKVGCDILEHPTYSSDLASSNYYHFPKLQIKLVGKSFPSMKKWRTRFSFIFRTLTKHFFMKVYIS